MSIHEEIEKKREKMKGGHPLGGYAAWFGVIFAAIFIALTISVFLVSSIKVIGSSMTDTLQDGDYLFMIKVGRPQIGDVVVLNVPSVSTYPLIKRVIGVEGDTIYSENQTIIREFTDNQGRKIKQIILDEAYVSQASKDKNTHYNQDFHCVVGKDQIFVLGDNRWNSNDGSRFGPQPIKNVEGIVPQWIIDSKKAIKAYFDFIGKIFPVREAGQEN